MPALLEVFKGFSRRRQAGRQADGAGVLLDRLIIPLAHLLQNIAHLVHPATLVQHVRVDHLDGRSQTGTAIVHNERQVLCPPDPAGTGSPASLPTSPGFLPDCVGRPAAPRSRPGAPRRPPASAPACVPPGAARADSLHPGTAKPIRPSEALGETPAPPRPSPGSASTPFARSPARR
jgi:hypothetical protein